MISHDCKQVYTKGVAINLSHYCKKIYQRGSNGDLLCGSRTSDSAKSITFRPYCLKRLLFITHSHHLTICSLKCSKGQQRERSVLVRPTYFTQMREARKSLFLSLLLRYGLSSRRATTQVSLYNMTHLDITRVLQTHIASKGIRSTSMSRSRNFNSRSGGLTTVGRGTTSTKDNEPKASLGQDLHWF